MKYVGACQGSQSRHWRGAIIGVGLMLLSILPIPRAVDARRPAPQAEDAEERVSTPKGAKGQKAVPYKYAILMDAETGKILFEKDAHTPSPPASMVKMMTTLIIMEKIRDGALKFSDMVTA